MAVALLTISIDRTDRDLQGGGGTDTTKGKAELYLYWRSRRKILFFDVGYNALIFSIISMKSIFCQFWGLLPPLHFKSNCHIRVILI